MELDFQTRLDEIWALTSSEENYPSFSLETLLDTFVAVYSDCKAADNQSQQILKFLQKCSLFNFIIRQANCGQT
jgi:hypothetical protein